MSAVLINAFLCPVCVQGRYCPTTCGVADYMLRYLPNVNRDLDSMQRDLETIANLTQGADETVVYMKDSVTSAQKSGGPGLSAVCFGVITSKYFKYCCQVMSDFFFLFFFYVRHTLQKVIKHSG